MPASRVIRRWPILFQSVMPRMVWCKMVGEMKVSANTGEDGWVKQIVTLGGAAERRRTAVRAEETR